MPIPTLVAFTEQSTFLANDFQSHHHTKNASMGVFFLFELHTLNDEKLFALIKYDNEDVVRYVLDAEETSFRFPDSNVSVKASSRKRKPCRKLLWSA
jgi:hypothetical protein